MPAQSTQRLGDQLRGSTSQDLAAASIFAHTALKAAELGRCEQTLEALYELEGQLDEARAHLSAIIAELTFEHHELAHPWADLAAYAHWARSLSEELTAPLLPARIRRALLDALSAHEHPLAHG